MHDIIITLAESSVTKNVIINVRQGDIFKSHEVAIPSEDVTGYKTSDEVEVGGKGLTSIKVHYLSDKNPKAKRMFTNIIFKDGVLKVVM